MLDNSVVIEVIGTKKDKHYKLTMTFGEWMNSFKKKKGWTYNAYQLNFSQYKLTPIEK